ncbi:MAG: hypothetical protein Ct9H300mP21_10330 [Pseudomonadota bacterium]|nr:MAG: hypothetical protein Ct9H300mP21_10330 [Pseudomonadota bacterium]
MIIYKTVYGELSLGDLTFLSGSFLRLRSLMEAILIRFSSIADSALYLRTCLIFPLNGTTETGPKGEFTAFPGDY